ncbi:cobalamin biosynthesis protein CobW [Methylophilaceae bacterium]|nr:cobalamin biosynthesis protein CobW [Methylophilaceae bacterium]
MDKRIPVTLLTGFLGSGKTTLLSKLLNHPDMKDTAVVINELGEAGLDHILARTVESQHIADNTVLLESGCLCCTLTNEMADTLRDLFFKRALGAIPEFRRLVIETTGMADPGPIMANLLNEPVINSTYRLDAVVVTIDSVYGLEQIGLHIEARKQAAVADVLLLTKVDLASREQMAALTDKLLALNPGATLHRITHGHIDPQAVINVGLFDPETRKAQPQRWLREVKKPSINQRGTLPGHAHDNEIGSFTVTLPKPLNWDQLEPVLKWLCATFGENLLRMKGIVHAEDQPAPLAVHAVQRTLYPPTLLKGWDEDEPITRVVLIGKDLDEPKIRSALMQI